MEKYRVAVALDPESWTAYDNWGITLLADGDLDGAIEKFRLAIDIDDRAPEPHRHLFDALLRRKDVDGLVRAFHHMANASEDHAAQLSAMAVDLARKPDLPTASRLVMSFKSTVPKDCDFHEQEAHK